MTKHIDLANIKESLEVISERLQKALRVTTEEKPMLKTIKKTKQMRLDELIKYVWDNDIRNKIFVSSNNSVLSLIDGVPSETPTSVNVSSEGIIDVRNLWDKDVLFKVEVEEEITEDTEFEALYVMMDYKRVYTTHNIKTVKEIKEYFNFSGELELLHQIYAMVDGKLELIWGSEEE